MKAKLQQPGSVVISHSDSDRVSYLEPEPMSAEKEKLILDVVEQDLFAEIRKERQRAAQQTKVRINWFWLTGLSGSLVAAAMALFWLVWPVSMPPLEVKGMVAFHTRIPPPPRGQLKFQTSRKRSGILRVSKRWRVRTAPNTSIVLHRKASGQVALDLRKGQVNIAVVSKTMKDFTVRCGPYRVVVRGTQFSVARTKHWMRVEVYRGQVQVHGPNQQYGLNAGQGLRFPFGASEKQSRLEQPDAANITAVPYKAAPTPGLSPEQHLDWVKKNDPEHLYLLALDLIDSQHLSVKRRREIVMGASDFLRQRKQYKRQYELLSSLLKLSLQKYARSNVLSESWLACRRWKGDYHPLCKSVAGRLLREHPDCGFLPAIRDHYRKDATRPKR